MYDPREELGYTPTPRKKRVPISDFGKRAKAEQAKKYMREVIKQLKQESNNDLLQR